MRSYYMEVTPEKAAALLRTVNQNRSLTQNWVDTLARDMSEGRWHEDNPQGLVIRVREDVTCEGASEIPEDAALDDGQHRMAAVVKSKKNVKFWTTEVTTGDSFRFLDGGRPRSMADRLRIEGIADNTQMAALARKVFAWKLERPWSCSITPSRDELQQIIDDGGQLMLDAARFAHNWKGQPYPSVAGFAWWLFANMGTAARDEADWFMGCLRTGAGMPEQSGVLALHSHLWREHRGGHFVKPQLTLAYVILAWNHQQANRPIKRLLFRDALSNENYPRPVSPGQEESDGGLPV